MKPPRFFFILPLVAVVALADETVVFEDRFDDFRILKLGE
jgi:hypothetical protein